MEFIKNPYDAVLQEIAGGLWDHDRRVDDGEALPYNYDSETFKACLKIFMSGMMVALWNRTGELSQSEREQEAVRMGQAIRDFVRCWTEIDTHKL